MSAPYIHDSGDDHFILHILDLLSESMAHLLQTPAPQLPSPDNASGIEGFAADTVTNGSGTPGFIEGCECEAMAHSIHDSAAQLPDGADRSAPVHSFNHGSEISGA